MKHWIRRNTAMNSIKTIIAAATLSALSLGAAQAAETIKPVQGVSFHAGTQHAVAYFLNDNATCKLVVTAADDANYVPTRFDTAIADGSSARLDFPAGKSLEFRCRDGAQAMTVITLEAIANR
jgi:hypothetical protein